MTTPSRSRLVELFGELEELDADDRKRRLNELSATLSPDDFAELNELLDAHDNVGSRFM